MKTFNNYFDLAKWLNANIKDHDFESELKKERLFTQAMVNKKATGQIYIIP